MSEGEWKSEEEQVIEDLKQFFRKEQIANEGNDPKTTGRSFGTPHDLAALQLTSKAEGEEVKNLYTTDERENNPGRPEKEGSFGRDKDKAFGRDPDGRKSNDAAMNVNLQAHYMRGLDKYRAVEKTMILHEDRQNTIGMLDESSLLNEDE